MQVTIAVGQSLSGAALFTAQRPAALDIPANMEGSVLTFQGTYDGVNYKNIYWVDPVDSTAKELELDFVSPSFLVLPPDIFRAVQGLKIRSGTSGAPTNQAGAGVNIQVIGA